MSKRTLSSLAVNSQKQSVNVYVILRENEVDFENNKNGSMSRNGNDKIVTISPEGEKRSYQFTQVLTDEAGHSKVFRTVAKPLLDNLLKRSKNGVIFTYGRTGAGKTYTMEGPHRDGLIYRTFSYIFNSIEKQQTQRNFIKLEGNSATVAQDGYYPTLIEEQVRPQAAISSLNRIAEDGQADIDRTTQFCVFLSIVELYMKEIRDLLDDNKQKIELRSDSNINGASQHEIKSADEAARLYGKAKEKRRTLKTPLNEKSSRGHLVVILRLVSGNIYSDKNLSVSQFCLVDLAGSERTKLSCVSGSGLQEACSINNSLGVLRQCIMALKETRSTGTPNTPRKPANVPYRNDNLTRLLKTYFEGNGSISMILCVKPDASNFKENQYAMEFGTQTRDVRIENVSPAKQMKTELTFKEFLNRLISQKKFNLDKRKRDFETLQATQNEFRVSLCKLVENNSTLKKEVQAFELKLSKQNEFVESLEEQLKTTTDNNKKLRCLNDKNKTRIRELNAELEESAHYKTKLHRIQKGLSNFMNVPTVTNVPSAPSAPMQSSSPIPGPSTTESTETHTDPITNTSSGTIDYHQNSSPTSKQTLAQSSSGVPVVNPRHNRSLSCSSLQWIHHKPKGTIDTGTVLKPKFKNGKSVRKLRSSDILRRDAGGYSVVHQDADNNGDIETKVYKGHIISTVCGGAQVILDDIETMRQVSPKTRRQRAASDVHYDF